MVAAVVVASVAGVQDARAAATARLDVFPERPRAGEVATIQLRTFWMYPRRPPAIFDREYPMRLSLFAPAGRRREIRLVRDRDDPYVWRGTFRFPSRGAWTVCGANWQYALTRPCAPANPTRTRVHVRVRTARVDAWHRLQRPLQTPSVADGAQCPTSAANGLLSRFGGFTGPAWGKGPAYPAGLGNAKPVLSYADPIPPQSGFHGSAWFGNKVLWVVDRDTYRGPLLIRGRQVDGPNRLRFERGRVPPLELRLEPTATDYPSYTRVRAPGCYAYQVDGIGFSYTIVFEARPS